MRFHLHRCRALHSTRMFSSEPVGHRLETDCAFHFDRRRDGHRRHTDGPQGLIADYKYLRRRLRHGDFHLAPPRAHPAWSPAGLPPERVRRSWRHNPHVTTAARRIRELISARAARRRAAGRGGPKLAVGVASIVGRVELDRWRRYPRDRRLIIDINAVMPMHPQDRTLSAPLRGIEECERDRQQYREMSSQRPVPSRLSGLSRPASDDRQCGGRSDRRRHWGGRGAGPASRIRQRQRDEHQQQGGEHRQRELQGRLDRRIKPYPAGAAARHRDMNANAANINIVAGNIAHRASSPWRSPRSPARESGVSGPTNVASVAGAVTNINRPASGADHQRQRRGGEPSAVGMSGRSNMATIAPLASAAPHLAEHRRLAIEHHCGSGLTAGTRRAGGSFILRARRRGGPLSVSDEHRASQGINSTASTASIRA